MRNNKLNAYTQAKDEKCFMSKCIKDTSALAKIFRAQRELEETQYHKGGRLTSLKV
jgi:hypothetical protein